MRKEIGKDSGGRKEISKDWCKKGNKQRQGGRKEISKDCGGRPLTVSY